MSKEKRPRIAEMILEKKKKRKRMKLEERIPLLFKIYKATSNRDSVTLVKRQTYRSMEQNRVQTQTHMYIVN